MQSNKPVQPKKDVTSGSCSTGGEWKKGDVKGGSCSTGSEWKKTDMKSGTCGTSGDKGKKGGSCGG